MAEKQKRNQKSIDIKTKIAILNEVDKCELNKTSIAHKFNIPKSTLSTIIKNRNKIESNIASGSFAANSKRMRPSKFEDIEYELLEWFNHVRASNLPISGPIIQTKAKEIAQSFGIEDFDCSSGWLWRFQKRHGIVSHEMCGEAAKVSETTVSDWLTIFEDVKKSYLPKNIFNMDETGIFYNLLPDRTLDFKGNRCHGGACEYSSHKCSWIDAKSFKEWLLRLNRRMITQHRKILLTLDNCAAHKVDDLVLSNIKIYFFPANTTSRLQPLDQGIIANLKSHYKSRLVKFAIRTLETEEQITKWNVLQAIRAIASAWNAVTPETIQKCFGKAWSRTTVNTGENNNGEPEIVPPEEWDILTSMKPINVTFQDFIQIDSDLSVCSEPLQKEIPRDEPRDEPRGYNPEERASSDESDEEVVKPSKAEVMSALSVLNRFASTTEVSEKFDCSLEIISNECIVKMNRELVQKTIHDFFK